MKITLEFTRAELRSLLCACESEEMLLTQYAGKRVQGLKIAGERAMVVALQSKLADALEADVKREQAEAKAKAEADKKVTE